MLSKSVLKPPLAVYMYAPALCCIEADLRLALIGIAS